MDSEKKALLELIENYKPADENEQAFKLKMIDLLAYENCFERSLLHAHFTASAWVVDERREHALLLHHAKLDKWLQLGGHADGDANLLRVAQKELEEESGATGFTLLSTEIFDLDIHNIPERKGIPAHDHYDVRFCFKGSLLNTLNKNHESKGLAWIPLAEITKLCNGNDSIMRMVNKTLANNGNLSV